MIHQVINEMEKVGDSQPSSSDPVSPTSNKMMKEPPRRLEIVTSEICFEKKKCVLGKLKGELSLLFFGLSLLFFGLPLLSSTTYWAIIGMVMIMDYLLNEGGDAIKSITALVHDEMDDAIKSITELDAIKSIDNDDGDEDEIKSALVLDDSDGDEIKSALVLDEDAITPITAHGGYGRICCMTAAIPVGRMPEMSIPQVGHWGTEVLYHSEIMRSGNYHNGRDGTEMIMDYIKHKTSRVSALQEIASRAPALPEVADTKMPIERSENSRLQRRRRRRWWLLWW